jgi:acyl-CoA reductase-like NAD-dependent aldehyde dehydrogenase
VLGVFSTIFDGLFSCFEQNPATNEFLANFPTALKEDIDAAVEAAEKAQPRWAALPAYIRGNILRKFSKSMAENMPKLAEVRN